MRTIIAPEAIRHIFNRTLRPGTLWDRCNHQYPQRLPNGELLPAGTIMPAKVVAREPDSIRLELQPRLGEKVTSWLGTSAWPGMAVVTDGRAHLEIHLGGKLLLTYKRCPDEYLTLA